MAEDFTLAGYGRNSGAHSSPMYDFLTGFAPRRLKDLFRWADYLYYNSPAIFAANQKLASYAVTEIKVEADDAAHRSSWESLLKTVQARQKAILTGLDKRTYGNSFISVYRPFDRFLVCDKCQQRTGIRHVKYRFQLKTLKFKYTCRACHKETTGVISDKKVQNRKRIAIIRWDPRQMDIDYNPITGQSRYYYTIPDDLRHKVEKGNKHIIDTMPLEFLKAMQAKTKFAFTEGQIFHMKTPAPAGIDAQWGLPPLTSVIKQFFYAAVLRKANEAIALDHIVPFRVLHPAPISGTADPSTMLNLAQWQSQLKENIRKWRHDPNHIMFAPTALGVTMMGGQGRSLLTLGEIKEAEDSIIVGMGIPREFLYGGLTLAGSGISLRMLENQLESDASDQNEQLEWMIEQFAAILGWRPASAHFIPFKLVDDSEQKNAIMQLHQLLGGPLSKDTLLAPYNVDLAKEREKKEQESIDDMRADMKVQQQVTKLQTSASEQAQQAAMSGAGLGYNQQAVIAQADQLAQQLMQMDPGSRRSQMDHLSQEDAVMYAVVKDRLEQNASQMRQQATAQMQQQQQGPMPGAM